MAYRTAFLLALLVYVALDLSLAAMPGAFVFEPADSVESAQGHRGRTGTDRPALTPVVRATVVADQPRLEIDDRRGRPVERLRHPVASWLRRPPIGTPPPSDDPH